MALTQIDTGMLGDQAVTPAKLHNTLDLSSKTLTLPAGKGFDVSSSSNPAYNTNPAGGVGTVWKNTSTGEIFVCTQGTTGLNIWQGSAGTTIAASYTFYDKLDGANVDFGTWTFAQQVAASSHTWGNDGNGLYVYVAGSGSTWMGVYTWVYTTNQIAIPAYANTMQVTAYIQNRESNSNDSGGEVVFGLGTSQNSGGSISYDAGAVIGSQDGVTLTFDIPVTSVAGTNKYFQCYGGGGQYANVIFYVKKIKFIP